nr:uncharacterized protein LOC111516360 [Leptinotarsa decemlineata]
MHKSMGDQPHIFIDKPATDKIEGIITAGERKRRNDCDLRARILAMKNNIDQLRNELNNEKKMLALERLKILGCSTSKDNGMSSSGMANYSIQPSAVPSNRANPKYKVNAIHLRNKLVLPESPKQHLQMIEQKCDNEMIKLQTYIDSIKHLRRYWRNMSFDRESKMASRPNTSSKRKSQSSIN